MSLSLSHIPPYILMLKYTLELGSPCGGLNRTCPSQAQVSEQLVLSWRRSLEGDEPLLEEVHRRGQAVTAGNLTSLPLC